MMMHATGVEITVMSGGSTEPALDFAAAAFREKTGHTVRIFYNMGALGRKRMADGEVFDVVIVASDSLRKNFAGQVEEGGISVGRGGGMGIMIRPGAPVPDISSVAAFKKALLDTDAVLYTTETSGQYIEGMFRRMGIFEQVQAKSRRYENGPDLMNKVLDGEGSEFALGSINGALVYEKKGLVLVGPLPDELQYHYEFIAVPSTGSRHKEIAWEFIRFCAGPGRPLLVAHGLK